MEFSNYLAALDRAPAAKAKCGYCMYEFNALGKEDTICIFCENLVSNAQDAAVFSAEIAGAISKAQAAAGSNDWETATKTLDSIAASSTDPKLTYVISIFYRYFSDFSYYSINYSMPGFMEQNAAKIRQGLDLTTRWKELMYRTLSQIELKIKSETPADETLLWLRFIAYIKLRNLADAKTALKDLLYLGKKDVLSEYAQMVLYVELNDKKSEGALEAMLKNGVLTSFYYLAKYLARNKKSDGAKQILEKLIKRNAMPIALPLLNKISAEESHY